MEHSTVIDAPIADVFEWHRRPGAIERLIPPWQPLHVLSEAPTGDGLVNLVLAILRAGLAAYARKTAA